MKFRNKIYTLRFLFLSVYICPSYANRPLMEFLQPYAEYPNFDEKYIPHISVIIAAATLDFVYWWYTKLRCVTYLPQLHFHAPNTYAKQFNSIRIYAGDRTRGPTHAKRTLYRWATFPIRFRTMSYEVLSFKWLFIFWILHCSIFPAGTWCLYNAALKSMPCRTSYTRWVDFVKLLCSLILFRPQWRRGQECLTIIISKPRSLVYQDEPS